MRTSSSLALPLAAVLALGACSQATTADEAPLRVVSDRVVGGFAFPESVACDPQARVLYVSQFGSELKPLEKDGKGKISRVGLDGTVLEDRFLPARGDVLHKPKGLWVQGARLWTTDIDSAWVFDLETRRGRRVALPGIQFANDPAVRDNVLYVSDSRGDAVYRVEPADFLTGSAPKVTMLVSKKSMNPNGLYPARDGSLLVVGFTTPDQPRGIYALNAAGQATTLASALGRLDGVYQVSDGTLLVTEWNTGALARWTPKGGLTPLARGFKGPADFCVVPDGDSLLVVVPDLVQSQLRMIRLAR